eukprot:364406-Chlamydomonas_euryale.AAC.12
MRWKAKIKHQQTCRQSNYVSLTYDHLLHMRLHGAAWGRMGPRAAARSCMGLHGAAWGCMELHGAARGRMQLLGAAWGCMGLHGAAWGRIKLQKLVDGQGKSIEITHGHVQFLCSGVASVSSTSFSSTCWSSSSRHIQGMISLSRS